MHTARSTQAQIAERVRAAEELLARGTRMAEVAAALSRELGLSRRQVYRYLEAARTRTPMSVVTTGPVRITLTLSSTLGEELRAYADSSGLSLSETMRRAISSYLSGARDHDENPHQAELKTRGTFCALVLAGGSHDP